MILLTSFLPPMKSFRESLHSSMCYSLFSLLSGFLLYFSFPFYLLQLDTYVHNGTHRPQEEAFFFCMPFSSHEKTKDRFLEKVGEVFV